MDKQFYLGCLKTGAFTVDVFYDYYKEHNKREEYNFDIINFNNLFNQYISIYGVNKAINTIKQYYNIKFRIIEVLNKEGIIIGYY